MDYHEIIKKLELYSLERRRDRFLIINAWQQLEGDRENVLKLSLEQAKKEEEYV